MSNMFDYSGKFNQPLDSWDVSQVTTMLQMLYYCSFNQPLDSWDVSNLEVGKFCAQQNYEFNQCLSTWADKLSDDADILRMFSSRARPIKDNNGTPTTEGSWCQGSDVCGATDSTETPTDSPTDFTTEGSTWSPTEMTPSPCDHSEKDFKISRTSNTACTDFTYKNQIRRG